MPVNYCVVGKAWNVACSLYILCQVMKPFAGFLVFNCDIIMIFGDGFDTHRDIRCYALKIGRYE